MLFHSDINQSLGSELEKQGKYKEVHFSAVRYPENDSLNLSIIEYKRLVSNNPKLSDFKSKEVIETVAHINDKKIKCIKQAV